MLKIIIAIALLIGIATVLNFHYADFHQAVLAMLEFCGLVHDKYLVIADQMAELWGKIVDGWNAYNPFR